MRRWAAVEPVIGQLKTDHRMGRDNIKGRDGDRILAAAGHNFALLLRWLETLLRTLIRGLPLRPNASHRVNRLQPRFFTDDTVGPRRSRQSPKQTRCLSTLVWRQKREALPRVSRCRFSLLRPMLIQSQTETKIGLC
jgi:IS5 family transposase